MTHKLVQQWLAGELDAGGTIHALEGVVLSQEKRIEELILFIKSEEYQHDYINDEFECLTCYRKQYEKHKEDCELNNLIRAVSNDST